MILSNHFKLYEKAKSLRKKPGIRPNIILFAGVFFCSLLFFSNITHASEFVNDTFTGTTGTALISHSGETGATWTVHPSWSSSNIVIDTANRIRSNATGGSVYYSSGIPQIADYSVQANVTLLSSAGNYTGLVGRLSTSANTFYMFEYDNVASNWQLYKFVNGFPTLLNSSNSSFGSVGTTHTIKLTMIGTAITGYVDGVQTVTATDGSITVAGRAGIVTAGLVTDSTGQHLDNFSATSSDYTFSGPTSGTLNIASNAFTITPNTAYTGTITPATTGSGTFSPTSLSFTNSSVAQTFTYTPTSTAISPHTISVTGSPVLTNPASINYAITGTSSTTFLSDTFTDTTNTNLAFHTGEIGAIWTMHPSYPLSAAVIDSSGKLRSTLPPTGNNSTVFYSSSNPISADYTLDWDIKVNSIPGSLSVVAPTARSSTSQSTFYAVWYSDTGLWSLYKYINTTTAGVLLGSWQGSIVAGTTYHGKLSLNGTSLAVSVDGTQRISVTDSAISSAGKVGVLLYNTAADGSGIVLDNLIATNATTPSASIAVGTSTAYTNNSSLSVTVTGTNVNWTSGTPGSPIFSLSGGLGASIMSQTVTSSTTATLVINTGKSSGTLTVSSATDGASAAISLTYPWTTITFTSPVTGQPSVLLVPLNDNASTSTPLIMHVHGAGGSASDLNGGSYFLQYYEPTIAAIMSQGWRMVSSNAYGDSWGNQNSLNTYKDVYDYVTARYNIDKTILYGTSMGGLNSALLLAANTIPNIIGMYGVYPALSLQTEYNNGFSGAINTAYGINGGNPYNTATAGHDPLLYSCSSFRNSTTRFRLTHSYADTIVPRTSNTDAFSTLVSPCSSEFSILTTVGEHGDQTNFVPSDVTTYMNSWLTASIDSTPPSISFTTPTTGSILSGSSISLSASASDNVAVTGVQFKLDGANLQAEDTTSPYSISWDSTSTTDGTHVLTATARDGAGNTITSSTVTVTIDNTQPTRSSGTPSGTLSAGTTSTTLSLTTDESATCRYSTTPSTAYTSMINTFSTTGTTSHSTTVTGLSNSTSYTYYVRCIDIASNPNTTDYSISFSVNTPANIPPTANAGTDRALTFPTATTTLSGSGNDTDGSIASYLWTQQSGPTAIITTPSTASTTISGLSIPGTYIFRLTVTDNQNATTSDDVSVVVSATVPDAPTGATALADNTSAIVSFTAPSSNGGSPITGYVVTSIPSGGIDIDSGSTVLSHTITGLTNVTSYTFTVTATNNVGISTSSIASNTVIPHSSTISTPPTITTTGSIPRITLSSHDTTSCTSSTTYSPATGAKCPTSTSTTIPSQTVFTRNLSLNMKGEDIRNLQIYLNTHGFLITPSGPGSLGKETTLFGSLTKKSLIAFQRAHNILPATGTFGLKTRGVIEKGE
jgi:hypothetical protein